VLVLGQPGGPEFPNALGELVPTIRVVTDLDDVRLDEWDVVITDRPLWAIPKRIFAFVKVPALLAKVETIAPVASVLALEIRSDSGHICSEFEPPNISLLGDDLSQLVTRSLLPIVINRPAHQFFFTRIVRQSDYNEAQAAQASALEPILRAGSGVILAAMYRRGLGGAEAWLLPEDIGELLPWVEAAFKRWKMQDAQCFPIDLGWRHANAWLTPAEIDLRTRLASLTAEKESALSRFERELAAVQHELDAATAAAETEDRSLLNARGDELVTVVARFLRELGFEVDEMDQHRALGAYLEDLQVRTPDNPEWIALVEVKSYLGGDAKTNDLLKIERYVTRFVLEHQARPSACWYLVNQRAGGDPALRPRPLAADPDAVQTFKELGGLIVDTSDLFRLVMAVRSGLMDIATARAALATTGVFTFTLPPAAP
jgi:hypothetical protein